MLDEQSPFISESERAQWLLSDVDPWRVPDEHEGRKVRLIGELYAYRTKQGADRSSKLTHSRFVVGWFQEDGTFYEFKRLTRQQCREFVRSWQGR